MSTKHMLVGLMAFLMLSCAKVETTQSQENFNLDWNFFLSEKAIDFNQIQNNQYKKVNLPHDWVVEGEFDESLGKDAWATGYIRGEGYGYYTKIFDKAVSEDELVYVLFDGVYNNATIFINGHKLGFHPYGYSPFYFEISEHLNKDGKNNVLAVQIDHSRYADSRWYSGAGIYREVALITDKKLHIPVWGTFVTTPKVSKEKAKVNIQVSVKNAFGENHEAEVKTVILDADKKEVASVSKTIEISTKNTQTISQDLEINNPSLWGIDSPSLYTSVTTIKKADQVFDTYETRFGVRSIKFDTNEGFFLNGENMKIKGVCLHHDVGLVGAAVPKGVWKRRLQVLKDGGCNAIRSSHNPASKVLLEVCDEMGMLMQDEFFDEWDNPKDKRYNKWEEKSTDYITRGYGEHFQEWAHKDLTNVMLSHRNHPSIIQWSIGNEIEWTYRRNAATTGFFNNMSWKGNYFWSEPPHSIEEIKHLMKTLPRGKYDIGETAQKLSKWTKEIDTTRPVIANCILPSSSHLSGYSDALDIVGYSYRRVLYDYGHKNYPEKPIMGTENVAQYHEWKAIMERPFISGTFLWTGADYMGEIRQSWPTRVQPSGMINTASFPKGSYYMMKSLWTDEPMIHMATQTLEKSLYKLKGDDLIEKKKDGWKHYLWRWQDVNEHWNYNEGDTVVTEIYSNCDEIELFLNGKSLGKQKLTETVGNIYKWAIPYTEGTLVAKGTKDGQPIESQLITARKATKIKLNADSNVITANNEDVVHIIAELFDDNGNPVRSDNKLITFTINGEAKLLGVDSGWKNSVEKFQSNKGTTHNGKILLILQVKDKTGSVEVIANAEGCTSESTTITIE
ncbi:glycoside hydrolase family 2 TIM barrel-domain containing protein [Seonamhaeicola marinus]|uniref:Glycoside hydrolase family 2 protein n=1 Tax=Seonamhaeicola marinus TaxID=1912246 RepID=A0A5D0IS00_9FLAO|nr:glycoside hydrolase family 2 TIM barrel-domain containing protein [Seonamhaeicola marinus]TYA84432.1 glycoside hydrolase family 2 protein [Seonamhaeicola marinus]